MPNVLSIWQDSSKRAKAIFLACIGVASVLLTFAPVWDTSAGAAIVGADYSPKTGTPGTQVTFTGMSECVDTPDTFDVILEIDTDADGEIDWAPRPFRADGVYAMLAPQEHDFLAGDATAGPAYDVTIFCYTVEGSQTVPSTVTFTDGFTYQRAATTSSTGATTSTTGATTSTTGATTSTTGATTSTTGATTSTTGATTSTTLATTSTSGATTSTSGATTSTSGVSTSTSTTLPTCVTPTTIPGGTSTSVPCTTSTTGATTSTTGGTGSSTSAPATTTTAPGGTTSTSTDGTTSTSLHGDTTFTTPPSTCTVSDTTPTVGQQIGVSCSGFGANSAVAVDLLSTPVRLANLTANAQGQVSGTVRVPLNTTAGAHEVRFTGTAADGSALVRSVPVSVSRELPRTGDETWTLFRYSLLLFGIGLLATGRSQLLRAR